MSKIYVDVVGVTTPGALRAVLDIVPMSHLLFGTDFPFWSPETTIKGLAGTIDVIAIGADTYLKFFTPDYKKTDFDTLNAPNPAMFFDPATGISALLPQTANPKADGQTRSGQEVLTKISGTLPGSTIEDLFHLGDGTGTYAVSYGITDADQLRNATLTGPFFPGVQATYVVTLTDYGTPVEITSP